MISGLGSWLFDPSGLSPHGFCLLWEPGLIWLYSVSDALIGLAYFTIPLVIVSVIQIRPDIGYRPIFWLFACFILLCGVGHWLDVLTLWVPAYGVNGLVKAATAVASVLTAVAVWRLLPHAIAWPTPAQLKDVNVKLVQFQQAEVHLASVAASAAESKDELIRELTRRRAMEQEMGETAERYHVLLQSVLTEAVYLLDANGNIETWNSGAVRMKGYSPAEAIGQNYSMFFTPEDIANAEPTRMLKLARDGGRYSTEGCRVRKDGSHFMARLVVTAIYKSDGTLRGFAKVTHDITEQRIEEEQRAIIIDAAPNGMLIVDESGMIRLANTHAEQLFGYARGTLAGRPVETLVPEAIRDKHQSMRSRFTDGEDVRAMETGREFVGRRRDGTEVLIEILLSPVATPRGRIVVASIFDATKRRQMADEQQAAEKRERQVMADTNARLDDLSQELAKARDQAESASRAKSRFLAGMSHELRTPLSGIMGYAHLLHMEGGLTLSQKARVDAMLGTGKHLLEMISCVLDLSEIEAEHLVLRPIHLDPRGIAATCLDLVRPLADSKGLAMTIIVAPDVPQTLFIDPTRIRQILLNLLGNAVKYTEEGTVEVCFRILAVNAALRVDVVDTGPGISATQRQRLFQDFERLGDKAYNEIEGSGIGLALSARLASLMGGRLGYEDNPIGGSVFWLELPLGSTNAAVPTAVVAALPAAANASPAAVTRKLHVLIVDDVLMNRDIAASFLRMGGHEAVCVEGGAEAIAAAASTDFDVILMDVRMPEIDGLMATRHIRALEGARGRVPIVALTAHAFTDQVAECHEAGMDSHLAKPFDPDALTAAVMSAVHRKQRPDAVLKLVPMRL
jgi:PAS domain S-box-containing protein